MRIKNVGGCLIIFEGGALPVGMVADFKGEAKEVGRKLLKAYPDRLLNLDDIKEEEVVSIEISSTDKEKPVSKNKK